MRPTREPAATRSLHAGLQPSVLTLCLDGGPDDGDTGLVPAAVSVVPPERLNASVEADGEYVRHPQLPAPWTWRYLRVAEPKDR